MSHVRVYSSKGQKADSKTGLRYDRFGADAMREALPTFGPFDPETGEGAVLCGVHCRVYRPSGLLIDSVGRHYDRHDISKLGDCVKKFGAFCRDLGACENGGELPYAVAKAARRALKARDAKEAAKAPAEIRDYSAAAGALVDESEFDAGNPFHRYSVVESFYTGNLASDAKAAKAAFLSGYYAQRRVLIGGAKGPGYQLHIPEAMIAALSLEVAKSKLQKGLDIRLKLSRYRELYESQKRSVKESSELAALEADLGLA